MFAEHLILDVHRTPPPGVPVAKTYSKVQALCHGVFDQFVIVGPDDWLDLSIDWDSIDPTTAENTWPYLNFAVAVDGQEIADPKRFEVGPYNSVICCPDHLHSGFAMGLSMFIPPLPPGEHHVTWRISLDGHIDSGWTEYARGMSATVTCRVVVTGDNL